MTRRDMDSIRELSLRFEWRNQSVPEGRTNEEVAYYVHQMKGAALVDAIITFARARRTSKRAVAGASWTVGTATPSARKEGTCGERFVAGAPTSLRHCINLSDGLLLGTAF